MNHQLHMRRGLPLGVAALCLPVAAALVLPSAAMAATAGGSTVRAVVGGDGSVKSVKVYGADGSASAFNGALPLKMSIGRSVSGNTSTYTYEVDNTFSQVKDVTYTDTAGKTHTASQTLQLPLVAQLGVEVPKSFKNVSATNGVVMTDPDGTNRILYNLVLFSPLGSPTQSVTFTATGSGVPTAELAAQVVDPSTTQGLSSASQAATADSQQDDFWTSFATGGNGGLSQLSAGMDQIVAGLSSLHSGLAAAGDGANKLDAGTKSADTGAHKLSAGLGLIHSGLESLTGGLGQINTGQGALTTGISQIHDGQSQLTGGLTQIHGGQSQLTGGLTQISGGLDQLANATAGLPAASAGVTQLTAGINALIAGVGDDATANTLVNGVDLAIGGINQLYAGIKASAACSVDALTVVLSGTPGIPPNTDPCIPTGLAPATGLSTITTDAFLSADATFHGLTNSIGQEAAVLGNMKTQFAAVAAGTDGVLSAGINQLVGGLTLIHDGLSHPVGTAGASDLGGVAQGLAAVKAGLGQLSTGLGAAGGGITALATGAKQALAGSQALTTGSASALDGSKKLTAGSAAALAGAKKLSAGTGSALDGSKKLTSGSGDAFTGSKALASGLDQLSAGQHQVATGLPAAVDGSKKLLDGATAVKAGIGAVQSGATAPLAKQLTDGSLNAKKQLAILAATAGLASDAPGGAGSSYVLTQNPNFRLAASTSAAKSSSHTGRNVGIGLGAFAALVVAVVAGFALGRRTTISA